MQAFLFFHLFMTLIQKVDQEQVLDMYSHVLSILIINVILGVDIGFYVGTVQNVQNKFSLQS